ncbi:crossover junction endonuclease EME1 isoform X2 [Cloeon dipterum]|uniref:crossover junction endonuclease EME1 isoform X2 n=1 Tax=Cloeon dipterum TaxID=197152 RepID=UPI0032204775
MFQDVVILSDDDEDVITKSYSPQKEQCLEKADTNTEKDMLWSNAAHSMSDSDDDFFQKRQSLTVPTTQVPATKASKSPKKRRGKYTEEEKAAMEAEKRAKRLQREDMRRKRPENCLKYIILQVDRDLVQIPSLEQVLSFTPIEQCRSEVKHGAIPFSVLWHRELTPDENGHCSREVAPSLMQLLEMNMLEPLVRDGELVSHVKNILDSNRKVENFIILVYGKNQYFALKKKGGGRISKDQLEEAMVECQLELGVTFCCAETAQEVSEWLFRYTKAVAQEPFKRIKQDWQNNFRFHLASEKSSGVREDFSKIWLKSLKKFKRMPLETCQAIAAVYKTPTALTEAYSECASTDEAKLLLEDITVQRGVGPLAIERRVGPALSRRVHTVLTSTQPDLLLNNVE